MANGDSYALLICNGAPPSGALVRRLARRATAIVAADGGANSARRFGVRPDVIIGDLDSITAATRRAFSRSRQIRVKRQDNTDLEKALDYLAGEKLKRVVVIGATGGRIDFTLANMSVIWNYVRHLGLIVAGDGWRALPVRGKATVRAAAGTTVSLVPFGRCSGITLSGLHYHLKNASMRVGEVGVSNLVRRSPFTVSVRRGKMLLIVFDDNALPRKGETW